MWQRLFDSRNTLSAALLTALLTAAPATAQAQEESTPPAPITAETRTEPRSTTIGDVVTYTITVTHQPDIKVQPPDPLEHFQNFESLDRGADTKQQPDGRVTEEYWFRFRSMEVGYYNIPEVPVTFTNPAPDDPSQTVDGTISAPKAVVEVRSVLYKEGEPQDIRDLKPIIGAGLPWRRYALYALGGLAAFAVLYLLGRKLFPKRTAPVSQPAPTVLEPHEAAFRELEALQARQLIEQERLREHHFELSEIFRRYLGARYSVPALDWTTEEIAEKLLSRKKFPAHLHSRALEILHSTDWVKFSKAEGNIQTCIRNVQEVRKFIEDTQPRHDIGSSQKSPSAAL